MGSLKQSKACWACRSSKVRCNLNTPTCKNCARTGKECKYGLLLSWPRKGDTRRSIVSHKRSKASSGVPEHGFNPHFLNVGSLDIGLYLLLSSGTSNMYTNQLLASRFPRFMSSRQQSVPKPLSWRASGSGELENILMSHYEDVLSTILTSADDKRFRGLLIAMSFIDSTPSSVAVQQALYALIALYVYGCASRAMPFKVRAITALNQSFQSNVNAKDGLQHIAAGLLLSLYEMLDSSQFSYQWEIYSGGAKQVAKKIYARDQVYEGDALTMLNWMFYHDALNKFSARHWTHKSYMVSSAEIASCARDDQIMRMALLSGNTSKIINTVGCSAEILEAIAKTCDHVLDRDDPVRNSLEHIESLDRLERRFTHAKHHVTQEGETEISSQDEVKKIAELYRLAGLIYLYRAGKRFPSTNSKVRTAVEAGLEIITRLSTCSRAFPIIIIGCEARCDDDRAVILELLSRTQGRWKIGHIVGAQKFIEVSWAQDDLHVEEELDYVRKFDGVVSLSKYRPSFAASLIGGWSVTDLVEGCLLN
ncbi:fungal-specific transcription factor domain-containing protein [Tricladium varicosporioides]|nr:fungal-specific transcription factor domain-containing protein [Hymenoscyphus varicosporioides]